MDKLLEEISFKEEDGKLAKMFSSDAEKIAKSLENDYVLINDRKRNRSTKITQFRQFYEKILDFNDKAQNLDDTNEEDKKYFKNHILPFVIMLKSKVQYSLSRGNCGQNFVSLMQESIDKIESSRELQNFKYFLEAIIGYMPKK